MQVAPPPCLRAASVCPTQAGCMARWIQKSAVTACQGLAAGLLVFDRAQRRSAQLPAHS